MQIVELKDELGRKRRFALEDGDDPAEAAEIGIDVGVPDLTKIDWEAVMVEISNRLYDRGAFTPEDLSRSGNVISGTVTSIIGKQIIKLYGV